MGAGGVATGDVINLRTPVEANTHKSSLTRMALLRAVVDRGGAHRGEGTEGLGLQPLYRAMDFLEANKEVLEEAIYFRIADLLNLDVELNCPPEAVWINPPSDDSADQQELA